MAVPGAGATPQHRAQRHPGVRVLQRPLGDACEPQPLNNPAQDRGMVSALLACAVRLQYKGGTKALRCFDMRAAAAVLAE